MNDQLKALINFYLKDNKKLQLLFIDAKSISYDYKINTIKYSLNKNQAVTFSIMCAESVLKFYEKEYPKDKTVRNCLEYLKSINDFNNLTEEQINEIEKHKDAAYAASNADAYAWNAA